MRILTIIFALFAFGFSTAALATDVTFNKNRAQAHCADEWTKRGVLDRRMFSFCMEMQTDGYHKTLELYKKYSNVKSIDDIVAYALKKWTSRREYQMSMVAFEIEQQGESFLNLAYDLNAGTLNKETLGGCIHQWFTPNDPLWNMVEFCAKQR